MAVLNVGLFILTLLLPTFAPAARRAECQRACVEAIDVCAAARPPMHAKKATRRCRRQFVRACVRSGTAACAVATSTTTTLALQPGVTTSTTTSSPVTSTTVPAEGLPNFRGQYTFRGTRTASTCSPLSAFPNGEITLGISIFNGGFGTWLDGSMNGVDAEGERRSPPWWLRTVHDCIEYSELPSGVTEWCAVARLTVDGLPPSRSSAPPVPATVVYTVEFYEPATTCTVTYAGELGR